MAVELEDTILEARVKNLGKVYSVDGKPYDFEIISRSGEIISFRDLAFARISEGGKSNLTMRDSNVGEGSIFIPNKGAILVAPKLNYLSNEEGELYSVLNEKRIKEIVNILDEDKHKDLTKKRALKLKLKDGSIYVPTNRFAENELTLWLFKDVAKDYGMFLKDLCVKEMEFYSDPSDVPVITYPSLAGCPVGCTASFEGDSSVYLGYDKESQFEKFTVLDRV